MRRPRLAGLGEGKARRSAHREAPGQRGALRSGYTEVVLQAFPPCLAVDTTSWVLRHVFATRQAGNARAPWIAGLCEAEAAGTALASKDGSMDRWIDTAWRAFWVGLGASAVLVAQAVLGPSPPAASVPASPPALEVPRMQPAAARPVQRTPADPVISRIPRCATVANVTRCS